MKNNRCSNIEASIGFSRKWDALEAGREVAESAIRKLNQPPSFFLLFSTIHYRKNGGFNKFLKGVWDVLPEGTPLIGGTIAGFINNYGCYTRGATALAVSSSDLDVAVGIGKHTKINPSIAAKQCAMMIKNKLKDSRKNKLIINLISGPTIPDLPILGRVNVIKSNFYGWLATHLGIKLFSYFGNGMGKEEDIVDSLSNYFKDYYIIGGSSMDDYKQIFSYQFINKECHKNSVVALGCHLSFPIYLKSLIGMHETDKTFKITGSAYGGRLITSINDKPAKESILDILGITEEQYGDLSGFYYRTANYFPISFEENSNFTSGIAGFLGNSVALGYKIRGNNVKFLSITGAESLGVIDEAFKNEKNGYNYPFVLMSSSAMVLNSLGSEAYTMKEKLDNYIKDTPYLMICTVNENAKSPGKSGFARVYSFNVMAPKIS